MADRLEDADDWGGVAVKPAPDPKKRLAELKAKAPVKRKKTRPFAKVYLDTAARGDVPIAVELLRADVAGTNVTRPS